MSSALIPEQLFPELCLSSASQLEGSQVAVRKLLDAKKASTAQMSDAIDAVFDRLHLTYLELVDERAIRSRAELKAEELEKAISVLQQKYSELHHGLVRVLTLKFPGENALSIDARLESLLLASSSGAEVGSQPELVSSKASAFIDLIQDNLK